MDGSQHAMAGTGSFLCRIRLGGSHLAHADDIRVITQRHIQQHILVDVLFGVLGLTGDGVDHAVADLSILLTNQIQLTGTILNGEHTLVVGDRGQQPSGHCGLAAACGSGHTNGNAVPQAGGQKIQHVPGGGAATDKVILLHVLRVDNSNGSGDAHILIYQRSLKNSDSNVLAEVAQDGRAGIILLETLQKA